MMTNNNDAAASPLAAKLVDDALFQLYRLGGAGEWIHRTTLSDRLIKLGWTRGTIFTVLEDVESQRAELGVDMVAHSQHPADTSYRLAV